MPVCVLLVEPDGGLVDGSGNQLDKPRGEDARAGRGGLILVNKLSANDRT